MSFLVKVRVDFSRSYFLLTHCTLDGVFLAPSEVHGELEPRHIIDVEVNLLAEWALDSGLIARPHLRRQIFKYVLTVFILHNYY